MAKIHITGINGFFGRNLVDLWQDRHTLTGIDLPPHRSNTKTLEPFVPNKFTEYCDITDPGLAMLFRQLNGADVVVHLAACTRIGPSWDDPDLYYATNVIGSRRVLEMAQAQGVKKFIYFSSSSVYGDVPWATSEKDQLHPTSPYALSKAAAEQALSLQALKGDTELIIVRPYTMYGSYMTLGRYSLAISKFLTAVSKDEPLSLESGGTQTRDFIHAHDVIQALDLIIEHGRNGDIYNIGTGKNVSIKSIADHLSPKQIKTPARTGHVETTCADISKLKKLGFKPKHDIFSWLTKQIETRKL